VYGLKHQKEKRSPDVRARASWGLTGTCRAR